MKRSQVLLRRRYTRLWFLFWRGDLTRQEFYHLFTMLHAEHYSVLGRERPFWRPGRRN